MSYLFLKLFTKGECHLNEQKENKIIFRDNPDEVVNLTIGELDDLVYAAVSRVVSRANNNLYNGLARSFLDRFDEDNRTIIEELDQIKLQLKALNNK